MYPEGGGTRLPHQRRDLLVGENLAEFVAEQGSGVAQLLELAGDASVK